jgi:hypothetical protein
VAWLLCDRIGAGSDADPLRPAVADYPGEWSTTVTLEQRDLCLANCAYQAAFDSDARIQKLTKSLVSKYVPDDGEPDGEGSAALALKVVRRALLENLLGADDFGDFNGLAFGDIPAAKRQRLLNKLDVRGLDRRDIALQTTIQNALRQLMPQIPARVIGQAVGRGGTFTDDFNGEVSTVNLEDHTPDGGDAWTRIDGNADYARVSSVTNRLICGTADSLGGLFVCDDQGSPDQYVQYKIDDDDGELFSFVCNRATDRQNIIGVRHRGSGLGNIIELFKKDAGTFTKLANSANGAATDGDSARLESEGNTHSVFIDSGSGFASVIAPANDSFNATETRQGVLCRSDGVVGLLDDFEAGTLGVAHTSTCDITLPGLRVLAQGAMRPEGTGALTLPAIILSAAGQGPSLSGGPVPAIISGLVKSLVSNLHRPVTRDEE